MDVSRRRFLGGRKPGPAPFRPPWSVPEAQFVDAFRGLYVGETLISNQPELLFDQPSDDKRDRYQSARMLLSQDANEFNNRTVEFRLEEQIPNTTQWRVYQRAQYLLKR